MATRHRNSVLFQLSFILFLGLCTGSSDVVRAHEHEHEKEESANSNSNVTWYKGNLHTHSLWSDGNDFPEVICRWYKENGYHFLALSDHNILSKGQKWIDARVPVKRGAVNGLARYKKLFGEDWVETLKKGETLQVRLKPLDEFRPLFDEPNKFLLIQGEEITDSFERHPIHINATHIHDLISPQGGKSIRETMSNNLKAVKRQSARLQRPILAHLNHPNFGYAVTAEDMAAVLEEEFFEVYNGHPGVNHRGKKGSPGVEDMWDIANTIRIAQMKARPLYGIATDDSHNYFGKSGSTSGRGWVMVKSKSLTPESIIHAMQRGDVYSSSGVTLKSISYDHQAKKLKIVVVPNGAEKYRIDFVGTRKQKGANAKEKVDLADLKIGEKFQSTNGTEAEYQLKGDEYYVRAVIVSDAKPDNPVFKDQKKKAWTQPVGWQKVSPEKKEASGK